MNRQRKTILLLGAVLAAVLVVLTPFLGAMGSFRMLLLEKDRVCGDWRSWGDYSGDYEIGPDLTVTFSYFEKERRGRTYSGYGVYDAVSGTHIGSILMDGEPADQCEFLSEDINGDGSTDIGVPMRDGSVCWYSLSPEDRDGRGRYSALSPGE